MRGRERERERELTNLSAGLCKINCLSWLVYLSIPDFIILLQMFLLEGKKPVIFINV